jgi:hypothetical protein
VLALGACAAPAALADPQGEEDDAVSFGCSSVTFAFTRFPKARGNTVTEFVYLDGQTLLTASFSFDGPEGANVLKILVPPGPHHTMDAYAKWEANGVKGGRDRKLPHGITCAPSASFSIQLVQRLKGGSFDPKALAGEVGQTIEYAIVLPNTGNVPLTFTSFADPYCDPGTISGGPGGSAVPPGGSTTYYCRHLLTASDQVAGLHQNVVSVTANSSETGTTVSTHISNTVIVTLPKPPPPPLAPEPIPTPPPLSPPEPVQPRAAVAGAIAEAPALEPQPVAYAGRLGVVAGAPLLMGQEGCARRSFNASIVAAGVAGVTFSLDRHRLVTLTAKNARGGRLSTKVQVPRLSVGAHRLQARITMTSAPAPAASVTRTLTFLRCDPPVVTPKFTG